MERGKKKVILNEFKVENTSESDYPGTYANDKDDCIWSLEKFQKNFKVIVVNLNRTENSIEFDLIGIHCAIANAFRRILLSEVPSMAIEKVYVHNNTTLIKDEVLSHRLGLVPLKADPRLFEYRSEASADASEQDTLEYELKVKCTVNNEGRKNSNDVNDLYKNHSVYSKHIKWIPIGSQAGILKEKDVQPVVHDILLDKMRPGQELDLKLHAVKGIGRDHAKFSPVATASYRMHPDIRILKEVKGEAAERLQKCFSPGVIKLVEKSGEKKVVVDNPRYDSCSRIVFRHDDLKDSVEMSRIRDHFIFSIESVGALPPEELFLEAVKVLKNKCRRYLEELDYNSRPGY